MKQIVRYIVHITRGYHARIIAIILMGLANVSLSLFFVWMSKVTIDVAVAGNLVSLRKQAIILSLIVVSQMCIHLILVRMNAMTKVKLTNSIRSKIYSDLLYTRWENLKMLHSGDVLSRIQRDLSDIVSLVLDTLPILITSGVQFAGAFVMLVYFDPILGVILGVGMPGLALLSKKYYKSMRQLTKAVKESEGMISSHLQESQQGQVVIRTFERQEDEIERIETLQSELTQRVSRKTNISVLSNAIMGIAFRGGFLIAFIRSAFLLSMGQITVGTLTAYLQLVSRLQMPMSNMMGVLSSIISASASVDRLKYLTDFEKEDVSERIYIPAPLNLSLRNVSFSYREDEHPTINSFSLDAQSGEMVAIVGESGAGKTTLLRLLLGLIDPKSGMIELRNKDKQVPLSAKTRSNFVYVPQGASLFNGTVRDNLLMGNPDASDDEIEHVIKMSSATFVYDLPHGLNTELGEHGSRLSEGQSQRIAIARSLLRPGNIILLDEATSALDMRTSETFLKNLKKTMGQRIVIFITHQKEVADMCDLVINLDRYEPKGNCSL